MPFLALTLLPWRKPFETFRKGSNAQKVKTRDAGHGALPPGNEPAAVRSVPSQDQRKPALYGVQTKRQGGLTIGHYACQRRRRLTGQMSRCLRADLIKASECRSHSYFRVKAANGRYGQGLADAFAPARAVFEEVDAALGEELNSHHLGRAAGEADADRERTAALMAVSLAACACWRPMQALSLRATRASLPVIRSENIRACRGRCPQRRDHRAAAAPAWSCHARSRSSRHRRHGGAAWARLRSSGCGRGRRRTGQVCEAANDNGGGQVVVSGDKAAVERAVEIAKARGARRAMMLPSPRRSTAR